MTIHYASNVDGLSNTERTTCKPGGHYSSRAQRLQVMVATNVAKDVTCPKCAAVLAGALYRQNP